MTLTAADDDSFAPSKTGNLDLPKQSVVFLRNLPELHSGTSTALRPLSLQPAPPTALYVTGSGSSVVEVVRLATPHASWLLRPADTSKPDVIEQCGDAVFISAVDPLFAALHMLTSRRNPECSAGSVDGPGVFQPVESLLVDDDNISCSRICNARQLENLCDVKDVADERYFRLNDEKVMQWLQAKLAACPVITNVTAEDALEIVCAYLCKTWAEELRATVAVGKGLSMTNASSGDGRDKVQNAVTDDGALLAYAEFSRSARANATFIASDGDLGGRFVNGASTGETRPKKRKTAAKSKLADVDRHGLRLVSSFFTKK